jgi:hypothetical protein
MALPLAVVFTVGIWLLCGLTVQHWWVQFGCFAVTTYLMVELNNQSALIRIYSRMVSCSFLLLSCAACFLMPSVRGGFLQLFVVAAYLVLFQTYQDKTAVGKTYYAFLCLGLASMADIHILYYLPFFWLLMGTNLLSLSWRTWIASLLGLLTPYWFACSWLVYQADFTPLVTHFAQLTDFVFPVNHARLSAGFMTVLALLFVATLIGIVHFLRKSFNDKIRIRMLFGFFIWMDLVSIVFLVVQPQQQDLLLRMIIINTSPLIAHFIALTSTRATNMAFYILSGATLLITAYNVWSTSSLF